MRMQQRLQPLKKTTKADDLTIFALIIEKTMMTPNVLMKLMPQMVMLPLTAHVLLLMISNPEIKSWKISF